MMLKAYQWNAASKNPLTPTYNWVMWQKTSYNLREKESYIKSIIKNSNFLHILIVNCCQMFLYKKFHPPIESQKVWSSTVDDDVFYRSHSGSGKCIWKILVFCARFQHVADDQGMLPSCLFQVGLFVDFFVRLFTKIKFTLVGDCIL